MKIIPKICPTTNPRFYSRFATKSVTTKCIEADDINLAADCIMAYVAESRKQSADESVDPATLDDAETLEKLERIATTFYRELPPLAMNFGYIRTHSNENA